MELNTSCSIQLPAWAGPFLARRDGELSTTSERMQLAIDLAEENVRQGTGGPFGAIVVNEKNGELVSVGVKMTRRF